MADEEKTEEPTAKKRETAREDGQIASSRDIGGVAIAGACLGVVLVQGPSLAENVAGLLIRCLTASASAGDASAQSIVEQALADAGESAAFLLAAVGGVALVVGASAGLAQTGGNFSTKALAFKWDRLDVVAGLKRALASRQAFEQVGLALAKATVLGAALGAVLYTALPQISMLARVGLKPGVAFVAGLLLRVFSVALLASAALAVVDLLLAQRRINEQLKMTKQEIKDENKQQEGDPQVKGRLRQRMRDIGRNQMIAAARKADVVVVNPTHYAVALQYSFGQTGAPKLLAKGKDVIAARIREVARKNQIPIVANPPVARAVFAGARVGEDVPAELYEAVAKVLAYLYRIANRKAAA